MYVFLETNYGNTLIFKVVHYLKPSEEMKDKILGIIGSYGAWTDLEGTLFPYPYKIGMIWVATFRKCVGCSTKEQCAVCIWAAINTIAACFANFLPAKIMWGVTNVWVRLAFDKSKGVKLIDREVHLQKILMEGGVYGHI